MLPLGASASNHQAEESIVGLSGQQPIEGFLQGDRDIEVVVNIAADERKHVSRPIPRLESPKKSQFLRRNATCSTYGSVPLLSIGMRPSLR